MKRFIGICVMFISLAVLSLALWVHKLLHRLDLVESDNIGDEGEEQW